MGYLPETMRNYLLRLGWSHGDDEIISDRAGDRMVQPREHRQAARRGWISRSSTISTAITSARRDDAALAGGSRRLAGARNAAANPVDDSAQGPTDRAMPGLKERAKTLVELAQAAEFLFTDGPRTLDDAAAKAADAGSARRPGARSLPALEATDWTGAGAGSRGPGLRRCGRAQAGPGRAAVARGPDRQGDLAPAFRDDGSAGPGRIPCAIKGLRSYVNCSCPTARLAGKW